MTEKEAINVLMSLSIHVGGMEYPELRKYEHAIEEIICWLFGKVPPTRSELEEAYDNGYRAAKADFYKAESDDAISRKEALKLKVSHGINEDGHLLIPYGEAKKYLEDLPSAQQWIPVTERLPDPYSGEYLVTINDGSVYTDILWFDSPGDGRYESCFYKTDADGYGVACDDVIAWMPLPEAYKGENDG